MMARFALLLASSGMTFGLTRYTDHFPGDSEQHARIVIPVRIAGDRIPVILDTGAPWCVLSPQLIASLIATRQAEYMLDARYLVRGITYDGALFRLEIRFGDDLGNDVSVDATVFVPTLEPGTPWLHPNFIGLDGCLNRIWFTVDPVENVFYFGLA